MFGVKLVLLIAILAAGAAGGAIPLLRKNAARNDRLLGWGNAFAAGVFLAAGIVHMLPDADRIWHGLGWDYPMAFALAGFAFIFMLLVEHVLLPEHAHEEVHAPSGERFARIAEHHQDALAAYAVLTALSIHALLAGLALGAEPDLTGALVISLAIIAHKSAGGFALGVSLARSPLPEAQSWKLIALFAAATPLGGLIGAFLGEIVEGRVGAVLEASFLSIASGTFIYVATFDILRDEFPALGGRFAKWLLLSVGVASMSLLARWT
ncbi:MAG: ZIP family metal transporter [bacterium]|nr:ZIP family metal transporter [bacterium]